MHPFAKIMAVAFALFVAGVVGAELIDAAWIRDCERIGAHRSSDRVFDCKERK